MQLLQRILEGKERKEKLYYDSTLLAVWQGFGDKSKGYVTNLKVRYVKGLAGLPVRVRQGGVGSAG